jgi:phosphatidylethanolamine-binding protein (PEBP) family uncharacterized protein
MKCHGLVAFAVAIIGITGCGSVKQGNDGAAISSLTLSSGAIQSSKLIPSSYRCSPRSVWLPLEWNGVPQGTAELIIVIGVASVTRQPQSTVSRLRNRWIVGGIYPGENRVTAGVLPRGAWMMPVNPNVSCPKSDSEVGIVFTLYAMPVLHSRQRYETATDAIVSRFRPSSIAADRVSGIYRP